MKRTFGLISLMTIVILLLNMLSPVMAMSFSTIYERQTIQIVPENVEFDAFLGNSKEASLDINSKGELVFNIKVKNTGYLKNASIILNNTDFELESIDSNIIKSIRGNVIELNQITYDKEIRLVVPFKYKKADKVNYNSLLNKVNVTFDAVYVYGNNIQKRFNKNVGLNLKWNTSKDSVLDVNLTRYLRYSENNTMLTLTIKDGISDNDYPISSKGIEIEAPKLNGKEPMKVIVVGDDISYSYENGMVKINKNNGKDSKGLVKWNSLSKVNVTFLYDTYSDQVQNVVVNMKSRVTLLDGRDIVKTINNQISLDKQYGNIVNAELEVNDELSKGQLYNDIDDEYNVSYKLDVSYAQLVDKMLITQTAKNDGIIKNKKVSVNENNFKSILGNEGLINVYEVNSKKLIGTLTKDKLELELDNGNVYFEISKPVMEGILELKLSKVLVGTESKKILKLNSFDETVNIQSYKDNLRKTNLDVSKNVKLIEPISKAVIKVSTNELITTKENKLIFDVSLKTNELTDRLYKNPKIIIDLPEDVTNVNITNVDVLYTNDLKVGNYSVNGKQIVINLEGFQKKYNLNSVIEGPLVRIVANVKLNNLSISSEKNINLNVVNGASNETLGVSTKVKVLATDSIITVNSLSDKDNLAISQSNSENYITVEAKAGERDITASGVVVNNTSKDISNVKVLGRLVLSNLKSTDGLNNDLASQIDTKIASAIKIDGVKSYKVYYSANANATVDLNNPENGWTTELIADAKSYLIDVNDILKNGGAFNFAYNFKTPENMEYSMIGKTIYSVYYTVSEIVGNVPKLVNASVVGLKTTNIPVLNSSIKIFDYNTNVEYQNGQDIPSGRMLKYVLSVKNSGKDVAKDVSYNIVANDYTALYEFTDKYKNKYVKLSNNKIDGKISNIAPGETVNVEYLVYKDRIGEEGKTPYEDQRIVKLTVNIFAEKYRYDEKIDLNNNLSEGGIATFLIPSADENFDEMNLNGQYGFDLYVKNNSFTKQNNVLIKMIVPKELTIKSSNYNKMKFDERTRELVFDIGTLNTRYDVYKDEIPGQVDENKKSSQKISISFQLNAEADVKSEIELKAETYVDVKKKVDTSKILKYSLKNVLNVDVLVRSNVGNNQTLLDTDRLEYISEVVNKSSDVQRITIVDKLPVSVDVDKYFVKIGNNPEKEYKSSNLAISIDENINPGEKVQLRVITKPTFLGSVESLMPVSNMVDIYVNSNKYGSYTINNVIKGTANRYSENFKKAGEQYKSSKNDTEYKYNISGNVWNDMNLNGIKDYDELNIKDINVYLYNENGKDLIYDQFGNPRIVKTDEDGNYLFNNLKSGNYVVVVDYDSNKYNLTNYKANLSEELNNSKFINKDIANKKVAITDVLVINKSSIYNVNLGLISNIKFSLKLMQSINKVVINNRTLSVKDFRDYLRVDLNKKEINDSKAYVEYNILVKNNGLLAGYANSIVDYIPDGFEFEPEMNNGWRIGENNYVYNDTLSNVLLNPGEAKEVKLILSYKITNNKLKLTHNVAEIAESVSVDGLRDSNSKSFNKNEDEDDFAYADIYFTNTNIMNTIFKIILLIIIIIIMFLNFINIKKYKEGGKNEG